MSVNSEGGVSNDDAATVKGHFNDIIESVEQFRQHADIIEERLLQQQEAGVQALVVSRAKVLTVVQQCAGILQEWQQGLCAEVTGLTSVAVAGVVLRLQQLRSCKKVLDSALSKVKGSDAASLSANEMVQLSISLQDSVDRAANTVLKLDQQVPPSWPCVQLAPSDSPHSLLYQLQSQLSPSKALGHVPDAQLVLDSLGELRRTDQQSSVCRQGDWLTLQLQVAPCAAAAAAEGGVGGGVVPYLSSSVTVSGLSVQCPVHCWLHDRAIVLVLQAPPCLGFGELAIGIHCFLRPVKGSPLVLTLQGGTYSSSVRPVMQGPGASAVLPYTDHILNGSSGGRVAANRGTRSALSGCVCGRLLVNQNGDSSSSASADSATLQCDGACMVAVTCKEASAQQLSRAVSLLDISSNREHPLEGMDSSSALPAGTTSAQLPPISTPATLAHPAAASSRSSTALNSVSSTTGDAGSDALTNVALTARAGGDTTKKRADPSAAAAAALVGGGGAAVTGSFSSNNQQQLPLPGVTSWPTPRRSYSVRNPFLLKSGNNSPLLPPGSSSLSAAAAAATSTPTSMATTATAANTSFTSPSAETSSSLLELELNNTERRTLELYEEEGGGGAAGSGHDGASATANAPKKMRETFSMDGNNNSFQEGGQFLSSNGLQSVKQKPQAVMFDGTGHHTAPSNSSSAGDLCVPNGLTGRGRATNPGSRRVSRSPGSALRRPSADSARRINQMPHQTRTTPSKVEGGDFLALDSSLPPTIATRSMVQDQPMLPAPVAPLSGPPITATDGGRKSTSGCGERMEEEEAGAVGVEALGELRTDDAATAAAAAGDPPCNMSEIVQDRLCGTCVCVYGGGAGGGSGGSSGVGQSLKSPVGVVQLPDGCVVVCDTFNDRLVLYTESGAAMRVLSTSPPLKKPSAAVVLANESLPQQPDADEAVFAVKDHNAVYVFNSEGRQLRVLPAGKLSRPYGLTVDDSGLLVTVETGLGFLPAITRVHPGTGELTRVHFDLTADRAKGSVSKPRFIAFHRDQVLIVVDLGLDVVAMVSMTDGSVLRRFGSHGSKPGQFRDPSGVVCDADGYIILGDSRNHRIQVFSPEGQFLSVLRVDRKLARPSGLCLTPCGHLLVINYWENTVAKFRLTV